MSAVHAVMIQSALYLDAVTSEPPVEQRLCELIHDLRQPLSSIEAIAYYLEMTLPAEQVQARVYMRRLQQLVDQASVVLDKAGSGVRKRPAVAGAA